MKITKGSLKNKTKGVSVENHEVQNSNFGLFDKRGEVWIFRFVPNVNADSKWFS